MVFTVLPDAVPFGDVFGIVALSRPYDGPPMPHSHISHGEVRRSVMGVVGKDGVLHVNADNPLAVYAVARQQWEREIRDYIVGEMEACQECAVLVLDDVNMPPKAVEPRTLRRVDTAPLQHSIFDVLDGCLNSLRAYDGAKILVGSGFAERILKAVKGAQVGGRPQHPARSWYFSAGCNRVSRGVSMKQLQAEMPKDAKGNPPSASTIRAWEREFFGEKPPTETP